MATPTTQATVVTALQTPVLTTLAVSRMSTTRTATATTTNATVALTSTRTSTSQVQPVNAGPSHTRGSETSSGPRLESYDRFERSLTELRLYAERDEAAFSPEEALARLEMLVDISMDIGHKDYHKCMFPLFRDGRGKSG
ncbi:uncharacterized protein [Ptychodera flava]|uniref:uncharacterized protein isoform X2 n=1 Tax=Ptychodera flava TaxID=63121 RepID=UPI00396A3ABD